jgi:hypothetical protein
MNLTDCTTLSRLFELLYFKYNMYLTVAHTDCKGLNNWVTGSNPEWYTGYVPFICLVLFRAVSGLAMD